MDLPMELLFSAFIAIALSFLIANLVSALLAPDSDVGRGTEAEIAAKKRLVMEDLRLRSAQGGESGSRVEAVQGEVKEAVWFVGQVPENDAVEVGNFHGESKVVGLSVEPPEQELEESTGNDYLVATQGVKKSDDARDDHQIEVCPVTRNFDAAERCEIESSSCEEENQKSGGDGNEENQQSVGNEESGVMEREEEDQKSDEIGMVRCEEEEEKSDEIGAVRCEVEDEKSGASDEIGVLSYEESPDDDDDDWEGIERSELEKVFATAGKNAWQRLGNMNPDVAMERYVALLSEKIPGWMKDNYAGDSKRDVFQEGTTSTQDPKLSEFRRHEPNLTNERKAEMNSAVEGDHLTETSHVVEKMTE